MPPCITAVRQIFKDLQLPLVAVQGEAVTTPTTLITREFGIRFWLKFYIFKPKMISTSTTYRITAIAMALLVFLTSIGWTVDMHYCQGQLKTINFFGEAKSCHDIGAGMKDCPFHKQMMDKELASDNTISKKNCCSNKKLHIQSDQDQPNQVDNAVVISSQLQHFFVAYVETFLTPAVTATDQPTYAHYQPPFIPRDIYVLLETYLL